MMRSSAPTSSAASDCVAHVLLVAEDDASLRQSLVEVLTLRGYTVGASGTGIGALEIAATQIPHLAIVDANLPDIDGATVIAGLLESRPGLPVIGISANGSARGAMKDAGATTFLQKPFEMSELIAEIRERLERAPEL